MKSVFVITVVGLLLYLPFVGSPFLLDDQSKIVNNLDIRSLSGIFPKLIYPYSQYQFLNRNDPSRPLTFLTYAVNYAISKDEPWSYHLFDFLLHIANSILVLLISGHLLRFLPAPSRASASLLVALLFLVHPLNGGTVIYAYGRSDVLSSFFMLAALALALRDGRARAAALSLIFALALLTKQSSIVLPLGILGILLLRQPVNGLQVRQVMTPLAILGALYIGFRLYYFKALGDLESFGGVWRPFEYLSVQPLVLARYMETLVVPLGQTIDHFIIPSNTPPSERLWGLVRWLVYNGILYFGWRRTGRQPAVAFGVAFYYLMLLPTSSIFPTVDAMVERRTYLANFGLFLAFLGMFARRFDFRRHSFATALAFVFLALLALRTGYRNQKFMDPVEVWKEAIQNYPTSPRAINNAAILYMDKQDFVTAHNLLGFLVQTYDRDPFAHLNFANLLAMETQYKDDVAAERLYRKAIALKDDLVDSRYSFARFLQLRNRLQEAETQYKQTLLIDPNHVLALNNLALIYRSLGRDAEAVALMAKAREIDPDSELLKANADIKDGRTEIPEDQIPVDIAIRTYEDALRRTPDDLQVREGFAKFCWTRRLPCARDQYRELSKRAPKNELYRHRAK